MKRYTTSWAQPGQAMPTDPGLLFYLERLQAQRDRELWRAIAHLDRQSLPAGDNRREVVIYDERPK